MSPSRRRPAENRIPRFESLESRWCLSGNAIAHDLTGLSAVRDEYGLTGSGQTVAVIDTGIAYDHPALGGGSGAAYRVVGGYDFTALQARATWLKDNLKVDVRQLLDRVQINLPPIGPDPAPFAR